MIIPLYIKNISFSSGISYFSVKKYAAEETAA